MNGLMFATAISESKGTLYLLEKTRRELTFHNQ
jgi:uncharacterized membrane protein (UPF0127 family)